jgi:CheY-like chemotaxis protein
MSQEHYLEQEALERLSRLPLSSVALRILEVAQNDKAPVQSLADVIASDATFALRLLKVANLTSGLTQKLATVSQAVAALGLDILKSLALGLTVFPFEPSASGRDGLPTESDAPVTLRQLWEHAIGCAVVAGRLGARIDHGSRHQAFAAGFLHDVGRVLLYCHWRESLLEALTLAQEKNIPPSEAETLALGRDHLEVGQLWSRTADLDPLLQCAIRHHHQNLSALTDFSKEQRRLVGVVQLADLICEAHRIGHGGDPGAVPVELWRNLNLQESHYPEEIQVIKQEIEGIRETFGFQRKEPKRFPRVRAMVAREGETAGPKRSGTGRKGRVIPFPSRGEPAANPTEKSRDRKLTILVVEDHGSLCDMLSLYFMRYGYHVRTANDGHGALEILANEEIHLVLLDLMLPRMDGFTVLHHMRERQDEKPPYVIVVSAGASTKDRSRVLELGANEYMPKPFHLMRLLERIQNVEKYLLS